mgnify:CR=1 FL=1
MKIIRLEILEELTHLAGNEFGRFICSNQILPFINENDKEIVIELPNHIEGVSIGFIQGLKSILDLNSKGIVVSFKAKSKKLEEKLISDYNY